MADEVTSIVTTKAGSYRITHPADATDEQIRAYTADYLKKAEPETNFPAAEINRPKPESFVQGVEEGASKVAYNAARAAETVADGLGVREPLQRFGEFINPGASHASVNDAQAEFNQGMDARPTQGSEGGHIVGEIGATLPLAVLPGGIMTQGAAGGALLTDKRDAAGIAWDAAKGAVMSKAVAIPFQAAASRLAPKVAEDLSPDLQTLYDNKIPVTVGTAFRDSRNPIKRGLAAFEDRAAGQPIVGDIITNGRRGSNDALNTAAINRSLEPIGLSLPKDLPYGRRAIRYAGDKLSGAYEDVTNKIGKFAVDKQFTDDLGLIQEQASEMLPQRAEQLNNILKGLGRFFGDGGTTLDGATLKKIESRLGDRIRKYSVSPDADQQELGAALETARSALRDVAGRAFPEHAETLANINRGWAGLVQVERAGLNSKGMLTPAGYSQAVKQSSDTIRRRGYARGEALNQDLSDAASNVLPSDIPDSGTSGRWAQANILGLLTGGAAAIPYGAAALATRGSRIPSNTTATELGEQIARLIHQGTKAVPILTPAVVGGRSE